MDILFDREYLVEEPLSTRRRKDISIWRSVARRPMTLQFFNLTVRWQMISRRLSDFHVSRLFLVRENNTQVLVVGLVACYQDRDRFQQFDVDSTSNAFRFDRSKHTHTHTQQTDNKEDASIKREGGAARTLPAKRSLLSKPSTFEEEHSRVEQTPPGCRLLVANVHETSRFAAFRAFVSQLVRLCETFQTFQHATKWEQISRGPNRFLNCSTVEPFTERRRKQRCKSNSASLQRDETKFDQTRGLRKPSFILCTGRPNWGLINGNSKRKDHRTTRSNE